MRTVDDCFFLLATFDDALEAQLVLQELQADDLQVFLSGESAPFSGITTLGPQILLFARRDERKCVFDVLSSLQVPPGWEETVDVEEGLWLCSLCGAAVEETEAVCPACRTLRPSEEESDDLEAHG